MNYTLNEGQFTLLGEWADRSVHALVPRLSELAGLNIVITRDDLPYGAHFSDYMDVQLKKFNAELPKLNITKQIECTIADRPAYLMEFHWDNEGTVIYQTIAVIHLSATILNLTCTSPKHYPEATQQAIAQSFLGFQLANPASAHEHP